MATQYLKDEFLHFLQRIEKSLRYHNNKERRGIARLWRFTVKTEQTFLPYTEVMARTGLSKRTINERVLSEGITTYIDGRDRRRRLIAVNDLPKLIETRPAPRRAEQSA